MEIREKNMRVAYAIAEILENEECTVDETKEILLFINSISGKRSTVQIKDVIADIRKESQLIDPAETH